MRTNLLLALSVFLDIFGGLAATAEPVASERVKVGAPRFTATPKTEKAGDAVTISFAVSAPTDVAVFIEDANGQVVRHLVAGVLGKNPPAPLKADSLEQSIVWDGKDDIGGPTAGGPFKARVGLGLVASYAGQSFAEKNETGPNKIGTVMGLTVGRDGRVYVLADCAGWVNNGTCVHVFLRDGRYEKTIKPFPSNLPVERATAAGAFVNSFRAFNPLIHRPLGFSFYPFEDVSQQPAVTPDGQLVLAVVPGLGDLKAYRTKYTPHLALLDGDGGLPNATYAGPALGEGLGYAQYPFLAAAADSKTVYLTGLGSKKNMWDPTRPAHAIYSAKLPDGGPADVWFGEPAKAGGGKTHLSDPRGLAFDGKGHMLVADFGNNRVVVLNEKDRTLAGEFPVLTPNWLAVHSKTGAVYVQSGDAVIKFSGGQDATEQARLALPKKPDNKSPWLLALDGSAEPAVLWAACRAQFVRCEDPGAKLSDFAPADCFPARLFFRPTADPTRREVACKVRVPYTYQAKLHVMNEEAGTERVFDKREVAGWGTSLGRTHRLGPDGAIYGQDDGFGITRYDRDGKPKPFEATKDFWMKGALPAGYTGTTNWERDFSVDRKGDIYVRACGPEYHGLMTVQVYDQEGKFKRTVLWAVSDGMYGPRVDPKGNLYIMEAIKPAAQPFPDEFKDRAKGPNAPVWFDWIYGSIVKFAPEGGAVWVSGKLASPLTYEGWGADASVSGLRTTGGCLTGTIAKKPATLLFPISLSLDATTTTKVVFRLKNDSDGTQAVLGYHNSFEGWGQDRKAKTIEIKPNSDFAEYTFDLAGEKDWKGRIGGGGVRIEYRMTLVPTNGGKGSFSIDWVRAGDENSKLVWNFDAEDGPDKKLPAAMKKEQVGAFHRPEGAVLQGALWWAPGFSPVGDLGAGFSCHCTGSDFDVDDFGRVFAPDTGRFRVGVLDTNGNEILSFGGYGNQDCCGPDSYVMDPATKALRPRRDGDPKNLLSPFAKPEIALAWIVGLAVTDKYAYVDDVINKRVLRVKLGYAAEETCEVK